MSDDHFTFRLGRLLSLRERREEEAAIALATAQEQADRLRRALADLRDGRAAARAQLFPNAGADGRLGDGQAVHQLLEYTDARCANVAAALIEAEAEVETRRQSLATAMAERRALERLRERQQDEWRSDVERRARAAMDAVALRMASTPRFGGVTG